MQYVIRTDKPFLGIAQSVLLKDGTVAWTDGLTPEQYAADRKFPIRIVNEDELEAMNTAHIAACVTDPVEETACEYQYALECLPPCKWKFVNGVEMFHLSERISHNLVHWHATIKHRCFTFTDRDDADMQGLAAKVIAKFNALHNA